MLVVKATNVQNAPGLLPDMFFLKDTFLIFLIIIFQQRTYVFG